jgi:uncharacterized repeat protein (TIGR01451 family)
MTARLTINSSVTNIAEITLADQSTVLPASRRRGAAAVGPPGGGGGGVGAGGGPGGPVLFDPAITKAPTLVQAQIGDTVEFVITITNPNAFAVPGVVASDPLPIEVDFVSATTTHGTTSYNAATRQLDIDLGTMAAGQVSTVKIQAIVNNKAQPPSSFRNKAFLGKTASNDSEVQVVPKNIPATGEGRGEREWLITLALWLAVMLLPISTWQIWKRRKQRKL